MRPWRGERGEGRIGCIFWLAVLVVGAVIAWEMVPVKIRSAQLYDFMIDQASVATYNRDTEALRKRILARARDLDLPLTKENLYVERRGDSIRMRATYTVPVEFPGYTYDWQFEMDREWDIFIF